MFLVEIRGRRYLVARTDATAEVAARAVIAYRNAGDRDTEIRTRTVVRGENLPPVTILF